MYIVFEVTNGKQLPTRPFAAMMARHISDTSKEQEPYSVHLTGCLKILEILEKS
jgi:hypothetical protein